MLGHEVEQALLQPFFLDVQDQRAVAVMGQPGDEILAVDERVVVYDQSLPDAANIDLDAVFDRRRTQLQQGYSGGVRSVSSFDGLSQLHAEIDCTSNKLPFGRRAEVPMRDAMRPIAETHREPIHGQVHTLCLVIGEQVK